MGNESSTGTAAYINVFGGGICTIGSGVHCASESDVVFASLISYIRVVFFVPLWETIHGGAFLSDYKV